MTLSRSHRLFDVVNAGLLLVAGGASVAVFSHLPAVMAVHFDAHGQANGWASRSVGAFALPALGLGTFVLLRSIRAVPQLVTLATTALLVCLHLGVLHVALGHETSVATMLPFALGLSMLVLGQVLPRTQQNHFVGIRTPWSLRSKENWYATHRFSSLAYTVGGVASVLAGALARPAAATSVTVSALLVSSLAAVAYSFYFARRHPTA